MKDEATPELQELESIRDVPRAGMILHPLRLQIMSRAHEPRSATDIATELDLPRQKINYHVRELAKARFLRKAGRRKKRNLYEQRYVATARSYALSPELLGPLDPTPAAVHDKLSATALLALAIRTQRELGQVLAEAARAEKRVASLSLSADLRFESPKQRKAFTEALVAAVTKVIGEHSSPARRDGVANDDTGRPFRLLLGCHPTPKEPDMTRADSDLTRDQ